MPSDSQASTPMEELTDSLPLPTLAVRGVMGGVLMGLANLVPGISGGTMLLATGVYPGFISGIAELTTLRFRLRSIVLLAAIVAAAGTAILTLAGLMRTLVIEDRWLMYSLFIGLTLGGVPLVWRLARPATPAVWIGAILAFIGMVVMSLGLGAQGSGEASLPLLFFAGLAGASAMILPGVSGGYLLLLLGQYEPILAAIDQLKHGLLGHGSSGFDLALVLASLRVVVPVGLGVVLGIVAVSNLLRWLLRRYEKPTLGALLGLLFGAVIGLWPFQQPIPPVAGDVIRGHVVSIEEIARIKLEHWPVAYFHPSAGHVAGALALIGLGLAATVLIDRVGNEARG